MREAPRIAFVALIGASRGRTAATKTYGASPDASDSDRQAEPRVSTAARLIHSSDAGTLSTACGPPRLHRPGERGARGERGGRERVRA